MMNRLANCSNKYQGSYKKVLCVCNAGLLRSPTIAWVLGSPPFNFNTRAVGTSEDFALIPIDRVHVEWADEIVIANREQMDEVERLLEFCDKTKPVHCLNIKDSYSYRDPELISLIQCEASKVFSK